MPEFMWRGWVGGDEAAMPSHNCRGRHSCRLQWEWLPLELGRHGGLGVERTSIRNL